jgi:DNA-binding response OmpR family regulator
LRVFLAEDDAQMRRMIAEALRRHGHSVLEAPDGPALLSDLGRVFWGPGSDADDSVIISDARMPGRGGLAILHGIRQFPWCPPFILITAFGDEETHQEAARLGVLRVLDKPFDLDDLLATVDGVARDHERSEARLDATRGR